jgi:hypothetical protein
MVRKVIWQPSWEAWGRHADMTFWRDAADLRWTVHDHALPPSEQENRKRS